MPLVIIAKKTMTTGRGIVVAKRTLLLLFPLLSVFGISIDNVFGGVWITMHSFDSRMCTLILQ